MTPEPYKPSTSTIREEEEEVQVKQEFPDEKMVDPDEDDPIVESIPLLINTVPERRNSHYMFCNMPVDPNHAQIELKLPCLNKTRITISSSESTP